MSKMTTGKLHSIEALMQDVPGFDHYDSGHEGILPECRKCRFHRPFWKYQSCVYKACPYSSEHLSTEINQQPDKANRKESNNG